MVLLLLLLASLCLYTLIFLNHASFKIRFCSWMKPCNYVALIEVLTSLTDVEGMPIPVFMSRGNGNKVMTREFQ